MRRFALASRAILIAALALAASRPALANVEEFSTFSLLLQENDDESTFDHFLTRLPRAWNDAWARSSAGLRTSQGCLTSGEWFIDTDFRARAPLGDRASLGIDYFQSESDILSTDRLDFSFHFPMPRYGGAFAMFRPSAAKTAQDFALGWEAGADTSAWQVRATWTLEDVFNNFWAFRQTQVGGLGEPYERRPYEPALFFAARHPRWRAEIGAKWLTPSVKRIVDLVTEQPLVRRALWGATGRAQLEVDLGRCTLELRSDQRQARGQDLPIAPTASHTLDFRRQWSAEAALRTVVGGTSAEVRYLYQSRIERMGATFQPGFLTVDDRMVALDLSRPIGARVTARAGGMFDRIGVGRRDWPGFSWGTRNESRAYIGLAARFGRVLVAGVEGIELDPEPYDVWLVHDKGFLQLQTTF